jgi:hypothetical protein
LPASRLKYVLARVANGKTYLYYRRGGELLPLPGPEGSTAFLEGYHRVHRRFEHPEPASGPTIASVITHYLSSAEYRSLQGLGHAGYVENPRMVAAEIARFLGRTMSGRQQQ